MCHVSVININSDYDIRNTPAVGYIQSTMTKTTTTITMVGDGDSSDSKNSNNDNDNDDYNNPSDCNIYISSGSELMQL